MSATKTALESLSSSNMDSAVLPCHFMNLLSEPLPYW